MKHYRTLPLEIYRKIFVISSLRRASYRWYPRYDALKVARQGRNEYECNKCHKLCDKKDTQMDHTIPIVASIGFTNFDSYIERMFCPSQGFQVLCKTCHKEKSKQEQKERRKKKKKK